MASSTPFPPKSVTAGCALNPYVNGYVYTSGALALGSQCVAPTIELTNSLSSPIFVFYESRVNPDVDALANRQVVPPKGHCIITNFYPSSPPALSKLRVEDMFGNVEAFVLAHDPERGYDVHPLHHYEGGDAWRRACSVLSLELSRDPYSPQFSSGTIPSLSATVAVPLRLSCAPQAQPEPIDGVRNEDAQFL